MKYTISFILSGLFFIGLNAQSDCRYFHRKNCVPEEGVEMRYDSQSKSAVMAKGQTSEFHLVAYKGLDYRLSICSDEIIGDQIQLKIFEKDRVLIKPEELVQEEVYEEEQISNEAEDEYADETYDEYADDSYDEYSDDAYSDYSNDAYADAYSYGSAEAAGTTGKKEQPKFKLVKELLYDNAENSYAKSLEFTAEGTMSLILEISVPGETSGMSKLKIKETGCVGVLVEHVKSQKTGF